MEHYLLRGLAWLSMVIVVAPDVCPAPLDHGQRATDHDSYGEPWFTSSTVGPFSFHSCTAARRLAYVSVLLRLHVSLLIWIGSALLLAYAACDGAGCVAQYFSARVLRVSSLCIKIDRISLKSLLDYICFICELSFP